MKETIKALGADSTLGKALIREYGSIAKAAIAWRWSQEVLYRKLRHESSWRLDEVIFIAGQLHLGNATIAELEQYFGGSEDENGLKTSISNGKIL